MRNRSIKKIKILLLSSIILICSMTACGSDGEESVSIVYNVNEGELIENAYKLGTPDAYKMEYESLEEAIEKGKIILSLQDASDSNGISSIISSFNSSNDKYHVELDAFEEFERQSRQDRLKIELAAGKGPDIMTLGAIPDASDLVKQGCFWNLSEVMEQSGFSDDLFFPFYKGLIDGNEVYGISPFGDVSCWVVKEDVIGGKSIPSFETFVDDVLYYPQDAIFINDKQGPEQIMKYFLECSDTLWGMIDWDDKTCNFNVELFSKILDLTKRYSDSRGKGFNPIVAHRTTIPGILSGDEYFNYDGWVRIDNWFDEGNYPKFNRSFETLMVNAQSKNKEGAWAFVSYAFTLQGQSYQILTPARKEVYDRVYAERRELADNPEEYYPQTVIDYYKDVLETGHYAPYRTEPILQIIFEESGAYFSGDKEKSDVINVIQSRVGLFLAELK